MAASGSNVYGDIVNNLTIEGSARFGVYGSSKPRIINNGIINSNLPGAAMELLGRGGGITPETTTDGSINSGILKSILGGILHIGEGCWINQDGQIIADGVGSEVRFGDRADIVGGSISAKDGGKLRIYPWIYPLAGFDGIRPRRRQGRSF